MLFCATSQFQSMIEQRVLGARIAAAAFGVFTLLQLFDGQSDTAINLFRHDAF
jgi:hypothetical protein